MRKLIFLFISIAVLLTACGAPGAGEVLAPTAAETPVVAETPAPTPVLTPTPAPATGDVRFDGPGFSFSLPAELAGKVSVSPGISYFDPDGDSLSFYYAPGGRSPFHVLHRGRFSPRGLLFPAKLVSRLSASISITAMGEDCVIIRIGPIGGSEIWAGGPAVRRLHGDLRSRRRGARREHSPLTGRLPSLPGQRGRLYGRRGTGSARRGHPDARGGRAAGFRALDGRKQRPGVSAALYGC